MTTTLFGYPVVFDLSEVKKIVDEPLIKLGLPRYTAKMVFNVEEVRDDGTIVISPADGYTIEDVKRFFGYD